ncbi:Putative phage tail protein [Burkholderia cepacia]|uniref:phage tail protein n=1 Tax=Burkholderia cepacia TaxID=292 RepID=UPI001CB0D2E8|nr:phage tail protein [Burkholderia cepacia]CAG9247086.1 Putative phage tail protein [Burkholderia cepacia]
MNNDLADLDHLWSQDVLTSNTGDLHTATGATRSQQRVIRRLLTNPLDANGPPDYAMHPDYGAGLARYVGKNVDLAKMRALIRGQMLLEDSVAKNPQPQITLTQPDPTTLSVYIRYTIAGSGAPAILAFNVNS